MYRKILVGFDNSESSQNALTEAAKLAKLFDSEIHALWVRGSLPHYPETLSELKEVNESASNFQTQIEKYISNLSTEMGITIQQISRVGNPAKMILAAAKEGNFDLIVVGAHGYSGLWGGTLGHVADKISEHAICNVLIVRNK